MCNYTILTTIDLSRRSIQLLKRVINFCKLTDYYEIPVIIGHADRNKIQDNILKYICKYFKYTKLISIQYSQKDICNSKLRNTGYRYIKSKYMIICDIDIYPDIDIFEYMYNQCKTDYISMIPCIYLSYIGTQKIIKNKNISELIKDWLEWNLHYITHIAVPSSFICIHTDTYKKVGYFDESYIGHGYEDFDFIFRLALYLKKIQITPNIFIDKPYISPVFAQGFRGELAKLCIDNLIRKKIAIHLFHKKNKDRYYKYRKYNSNIFISKMKLLYGDKNTCIKETRYPLINTFFESIEKNKEDPSDFSILFKNISNKEIINKNK